MFDIHLAEAINELNKKAYEIQLVGNVMFAFFSHFG